jgi:hypothetical protein
VSFYPRPWAKPDDVKLLDDPKESVNITLGRILDSKDNYNFLSM